ncbi:hypothetical protein FBUS_11295, partial [Fasciolopsis buskii]
ASGAVTTVCAPIIVVLDTLVTNTAGGQIYQGYRCAIGRPFSKCRHCPLDLVYRLPCHSSYVWIMFNPTCAMELAHVLQVAPGSTVRFRHHCIFIRLLNELTPVDDTYTARLPCYFPKLDHSMGYLSAPNGPGFVAPPSETRPPLSEFPPPPLHLVNPEVDI